MKVCLVEVNWAMLFWFGLLIMDIIANVIAARQSSKVKKELLHQNQLIMEQNDKINTVIIRVCSKSVRERKAAKEEDNKGE